MVLPGLLRPVEVSRSRLTTDAAGSLGQSDLSPLRLPGSEVALRPDEHRMLAEEEPVRVVEVGVGRLDLLLDGILELAVLGEVLLVLSESDLLG